VTADRDRLTVLYDADCGVCRLTVRTLRKLDWRRRLTFMPLQRFTGSAPGDPTRRRLLWALHVRDGRGRWYRAGDAMLRIASELPVLVPLSIVGRLPGMGGPVDVAYRLVADNRQAISRVLDAVGRAKRPHARPVTIEPREPPSKHLTSREM
jgi:predicted DCC family thiol-disulfide oxidoreductase YuxK